MLFNVVWQLWIGSKRINVCAFVCIAQLMLRGDEHPASAGAAVGRASPLWRGGEKAGGKDALPADPTGSHRPRNQLRTIFPSG